MAIKNFEQTPHKIERNWNNAQTNKISTTKAGLVNKSLQNIQNLLKIHNYSGRQIENLSTDWQAVTLASPYGDGYLYAYTNWEISISDIKQIDGLQWDVAFKFRPGGEIDSGFNFHRNDYLQELDNGNYKIYIGFLWKNTVGFIEDFEVKLILTAWNPIVIV